MINKGDGRYQNQLNKNDEIKIDIYEKNALGVISGKINHKFKENTHWIAELDVSADQTDRYIGDIQYLNGFQDNFRYNRVFVSFPSINMVVVEYAINERAFIPF